MVEMDLIQVGPNQFLPEFVSLTAQERNSEACENGDQRSGWPLRVQSDAFLSAWKMERARGRVASCQQNSSVMTRCDLIENLKFAIVLGWDLRSDTNRILSESFGRSTIFRTTQARRMSGRLIAFKGFPFFGCIRRRERDVDWRMHYPLQFVNICSAHETFLWLPVTIQGSLARVALLDIPSLGFHHRVCSR